MNDYTQRQVEEYCKKFGLCKEKGNCQCEKKRRFITTAIATGIYLAIAEERERVRREIKTGVEKYKLSRQVGNMAGDYIFTYDLETFVLSSLSPKSSEKAEGIKNKEDL